MNITSLLSLLCICRRNNLHPSLWTLFDIGIVSRRLLTVIPVTRFFSLWGWLRLNIYLRRLLYNDRRPGIIRIRIIGIRPPPSRPPQFRAEKHTYPHVATTMRDMSAAGGVSRQCINHEHDY
jgi:hypothetical protein